MIAVIVLHCFGSIRVELEHYVWFITNVSTWLPIGLGIIKQFADQVRIRLISQLINGI